MNGTNAKCKVFIRDFSKAGNFDHLFEFLLSGKLSNTFNQVLIRLPISSQQLSHGRDHLKRVFIVKPERSRFNNWLNKNFNSYSPLQLFISQVTKFKTQESSSRLQYTISFTQHLINVRYIPNPKRYRVGCERIILKR